MTKTETKIPTNKPDQSSCAPGCPGYSAFDVSPRAPYPGLAYRYNPELEVQTCDGCDRYANDEEAFAAWMADGQPALCGEPGIDPASAWLDDLIIEVSDDNVDIHDLLRQLAKKAQGLGWDLPKLQDEVFAHFDTIDET